MEGTDERGTFSISEWNIPEYAGLDLGAGFPQWNVAE